MLLFLILFMFLFIPLPAFSGTLHVPGDQPTIQAGIDAALDGDVVWVAPGTYVENINFKGKAITLQSSDGPGMTVIDGGNPVNPKKGSVVTFQNGEGWDTLLTGFTLTNGTGTYHDVFLGNWDFVGGGIFCANSGPVIRDNIISENTLHGPYTQGGGIFCTVDSAPDGRPMHARVEGNRIIKNEAEYMGGGVFCSENAGCYLEYNLISDNHSGWGGGAAGDCSCLIYNNIIELNTARFYGGGISSSGKNSVFISYNIIRGNSARMGGGGIEASPMNKFFLEHNMIHDNTTMSHGGGVMFHTLVIAVLYNNTIVNNTAMIGGGICCNNFPSVEMLNCIFWNNTAITGPQIYAGGQGVGLEISYSDLEGGLSAVHVEPAHSYLIPGPGIIDADPLFVDAVNGDFHLTYPSPCRNTGKNTVAIGNLDFEGDPREAQGTTDMGADEFYTHLYYTGDAAPGGKIELKCVDIPSTNPVILWLGSGGLNTPLHIPGHGKWRLEFPVLLEANLGSIPGPDGVLALPFRIPMSGPAPMKQHLQALFGTTLTNMCVIEVE